MTKELDNEIGKRLKLERKKAGITAITLAKSVGKDYRQFIYHIESGECKLSYKDAVVFAEVLDVHILSFYPKVSNPTPLSKGEIK